MRDHTKLRAFVLADEVAILTYRETKKFPKDERWIDFSVESEKVLGALVLYATLTGYSLNHLSSYQSLYIIKKGDAL